MRVRPRSSLVVLALVLVLAAPAGAATAHDGGDRPDRSAGHDSHDGRDDDGRDDDGRGGRASVDVATYNLYLGADLAPLFGATSVPELVAAAGQVVAAVDATDFPARVEVIADLIADERPDVAGLQEVALWETAPGTAAAPGEFWVRYDFLATLLAELADRGVPYEAVATNTNFTGVQPIAFGGEEDDGFPDSQWARFADRDVIIARADSYGVSVDRSSVTEAAFETPLILPSAVPGVPDFVVPRGYSSVDVTAEGETLRFVNTHLEAFAQDVRVAQATELAGVVTVSPHPVVLVGDVNSAPPGCGSSSAAFEVLLAAGLVESWPAADPDDPCGGFTSPQAADLRNAESLLDERIDVVMYDRDAWRAKDAEVIGDEQEDRTAGGLWPSDHAGSVAELRTVRH